MKSFKSITTASLTIDGVQYWVNDDTGDDVSLFAVASCDDPGDVYDGNLFTSLLACVESWASDNDLIDSESELSERWDDYIEDSTLDLDDGAEFREAFNNWTDSLTREGQLHAEQYSEYQYTGKHAQHH